MFRMMNPKNSNVYREFIVGIVFDFKESNAERNILNFYM